MKIIPTLNDYSLGRNIKRALQKAGKKQKDLAEFCETDTPHVSKWVNDHVRPSYHNLHRIAEFTSFTIEEIISGQFKGEKKVIRQYTSENNNALNGYIKSEVESIVAFVEMMLTEAGHDKNVRDGRLGILRTKIETLVQLVS